MKKTFKEYHQFTDEDFHNLWKDCLFVFDTNTLLNMYRYSRKTVDEYFNVLTELKKKKQLWIPYQVGYEFYENRINVISEYENSYDSILGILDKAKSDIELKYKDHPFLNLTKIKEEVNKGLYKVEEEIKNKKNTHPKWIDKDDVLEKLNLLFENSIGVNYDNKRINEIKKEGKERYENKVPPGFKDDKKTDDKKYGDLILWYQIIDKALEKKKSIILISGDVKEDWWLEKGGKRLMPLPQLKKEIFDKAGVDFHIYTSDRFLEYYKKEKSINIDENTIKEVRKIREFEEERMMIKRSKLIGIDLEKNNDSEYSRIENYLIEYIQFGNILQNFILNINESGIEFKYRDDIEYLFGKIMELRNNIIHGKINIVSLDKFNRHIKSLSLILDRVYLGKESNKLLINLKTYINLIEDINVKLIGEVLKKQEF